MARKCKRTLYCNKSTGNGANFGMSINIDDWLDPQVAISGSNIVIVYADTDGYNDEFYVFAWVMDITRGTVTEHNLRNKNSLSKHIKW